MSTILFTMGGDFKQSDATSADTSTTPTSDVAKIYYDSTYFPDQPDTLVLQDASSGAASYFRYDADTNVTQHNTGFLFDYHDNIAGCDFLGGDYADVIIGGTAADTLEGGTGRDRLTGNGGADTLTSTGDGDTLNGGTGADTYVFTGMTIHRAATFTNFIGDTLDLSAVDADVNASGDQAFTLVTHFDGHAGEMQIKYDHHTGRNLIRLDTNGDGSADHIITIVTGNDFSHIVY